MLFSTSSIVHREIIQLQATPKQVREFIMTPDRILDYYPSPIEGGVLEPGRKIYCRGKSGVSVLELLAAQSTEELLVVKVTTATGIKPPFTEERIVSSRFFVMVEDWQLEETAQGTKLTKTWRDVEKFKMKFLPLRLIVRRSAKAESHQLQLRWDEAARDMASANR